MAPEARLLRPAGCGAVRGHARDPLGLPVGSLQVAPAEESGQGGDAEPLPGHRGGLRRAPKAYESERCRYMMN